MTDAIRAEGDFYVWHRDMGTLIYCIRAPQNFGTLTSFAWNRWSDDWMFATGTHEGAVHVWKIRQEEPEETPRRSPVSPSWLAPASPSSPMVKAPRPMMSKAMDAHRVMNTQDRFGFTRERGGSRLPDQVLSRSGTYESSAGWIDEDDLGPTGRQNDQEN